MRDPTTTHSYTTVAVPAWAAEVTGDARDAEIARLQGVANGLWEDLCDANVELGTRAAKIAYFEQELADVKAECCRLVDRNGDLEVEVTSLKSVLRESAEAHISLAGQYEAGGNTQGAMQLRAAANLLGCIFQGGTPATVCPPVAKAKEAP